jgi:hypothetical protein
MHVATESFHAKAQREQRKTGSRFTFAFFAPLREKLLASSK